MANMRDFERHLQNIETDHLLTYLAAVTAEILRRNEEE